MYVPRHFALTDPLLIERVIRDNNFATLIISGPEGMEAVHLPVLIGSTDPLMLFGHVSKANLIWQAFDGVRDALLIFLGPHTFISPSIYGTHPSVPTWNYVTVHLTGSPQIVDEASRVESQLRKMVAFFDPDLVSSYPEDLDQEYISKMRQGIVAFEVTCRKLEAKAKLGQNRSSDDRYRIYRHLSESARREENQLADWMKWIKALDD